MSASYTMPHYVFFLSSKRLVNISSVQIVGSHILAYITDKFVK
jgi:hypothetical protein